MGYLTNDELAARQRDARILASGGNLPGTKSFAAPPNASTPIVAAGIAPTALEPPKASVFGTPNQNPAVINDRSMTRPVSLPVANKYPQINSAATPHLIINTGILTDPQAKQELELEALTKRPGGLNVSGGARRPDSPVLSGKLLEETNRMGQSSPATTATKPSIPLPPSWGRGMAMNDVKPGEAMVTSYSPETTRTKFDNLGYQTQEKIPGTPTMIGYRQNDKTGQLEKFGADGSKLADLGSFKPHKDAEKNTAMFWANNGMPGGAAQYRQEREKRGGYQAMDGLMADATNAQLSPDQRANAAHMFGALAQRLDKFGDGQLTEYQKASLGIQQQGLDERRNATQRLVAKADYDAQKDQASANRQALLDKVNLQKGTLDHIKDLFGNDSDKVSMFMSAIPYNAKRIQGFGAKHDALTPEHIDAMLPYFNEQYNKYLSDKEGSWWNLDLPGTTMTAADMLATLPQMAAR